MYQIISSYTKYQALCCEYNDSALQNKPGNQTKEQLQIGLYQYGVLVFLPM